MSNFMMMPIALTISTTLCLVSNSWLLIWIVLEINTMSFCSMMKSKNMKMIEMSMKYFIIQSIASAILLFSMMIIKPFTGNALFMMLGVISLMIKMAASPFQEWFISVTKNMKFKNAAILMTWQKLAPVYLIIFQMKKLILLFIILSASLGATLQMNKNKLLEIMAYSSVFNLSWMLLAITSNTGIFFIYSILYWSTVLLMIMMMNKTKKKTIQSMPHTTLEKWVILMTTANLGGIPPLTGFLSKWMIMKELLGYTLIFLLTTILTLSAVNLFVYLRMMLIITMKTTNPMQINTIKSYKKFFILLMMMMFMPMTLLMLLGHAWNKGL